MGVRWFWNRPQKIAVAVEGPGSLQLDEFEGRLVVAIDVAVAELTVRVAVDDLDALLAIHCADSTVAAPEQA